MVRCNTTFRIWKRGFHILLFTVILTICPLCTFAQTTFSTQHLTPNDGLPYRWALDVTQDSLGYIWIATYDGLCRYEGHRFTSFAAANHPSHSDSRRIMQVDCLPGNRIMATTEWGGLVRANLIHNRLEFVSVHSASEQILKVRPLLTIPDIYQYALLGESASGTEWFSLLNPFGATDTLVQLNPHSRIWKHCIPMDAGRVVFAMSNNAYYIFVPNGRTYREYPFSSIPDKQIVHSALPIDAAYHFWYPASERTFRSFILPENVLINKWQSFKADNKGNLWIWTEDKITYRYSVSKDTLEYFGVFDFLEYTIGNPFEDREGTIWIPHFYGITKLVAQRKLFETYLNKPLNVLGNPSGGVSIYNLRLSADSSVYFRVSEDLTYRIEQTTGKPEIAKTYPPNLPHTDELQLRDALQHLKLDTVDLSNKTVYCYSNKREWLWITRETSKGVHLITSETETARFFELSDDPVTIMCMAFKNDWLWVGTDDGLYALNPKDGHHQRYTTRDGLPHNIVYSILLRGDELWLGTHEGLCRFNTTSGVINNYFVEDGLTHNEFNRRSALLAPDGKMYFGGINGLIAFYPADFEADSASAIQSSLYLNSFGKIDGLQDTFIEMSFAGKHIHRDIRLHHADRSFVFGFSLTSFINPTQNSYLYYLDGWELPWSNETNTGRALYPHLPTGHYTLRVKATDPLGNVAANEISLPLYMPQPWYLRWWAWCIYLIVLVGGSFLYYRIRLRQQLEQQEALRLRELDEVKTRLYTNITHEFRTPLTLILGLTQQVKATLQEKELLQQWQYEISDKLSVIKRNGENLLQLVNQMLDLAKLESGNLSLHLIQADLVYYLKYLTSTFQSFAAQKQITLHFTSDTERFVMDFDKTRILNIITNLISNAVKFTPEGGSIYVHTKADDGRFLIHVKDTGIGIPEDKLLFIFDRFYQVHDSHTRQGEGTGIGLTLVKELVKMLRGDIKASSRSGHGTEFTVSLPVTREAPFSSESQDNPAYIQLTAPPTSVTMTHDQEDNELPLLLTVEDNIDVAQYIISCLSGKFRFIHAANGEIGIAMAIAEIPDLIISDVMMPVKDGYELVQTLKQDHRTNHIPIVLLTAKADTSSRLAGLEYGVDAYLAKPFHEKELQLQLRNLLELRKRLQEKYVVQSFEPAVTPQDGTSIEVQDAFLRRANEVILVHLDDTAFGGESLSRAMTMSESQLNRKIKALTGQTLSIFIRSVRLREGLKLLTNSEMTIAEIAYTVGFSDPAYFSRTFSQEFGKAPSAFRN